jgi:hypothetical protein
MTIRTLRFCALILACLTVGMKFAHAMELPPKLSWDAELYFPVQTSLYTVFAVVGPIVNVGALLFTAGLLVALRGNPAFRLTATSLAAMSLSIGIWLGLVAPAHVQLMTWVGTYTVPEDWMRWRSQWQYGQAAAFVCDLSGFALLLFSVIRPEATEKR